MKKLIIIFLLFSNIIFASDFEINFGTSFGCSAEFTYIKGDIPLWLGYQDGNRVDGGATVNAFVLIGRNYKILNEKLTSISVLFDTGYNFYIRNRTYEPKYNEYSSYIYHSLILGGLVKLNFYKDISFGVGGGILFPFYSATDKEDWMLGIYKNISKFTYEKISYMYKVPIMPYIKLNLEKHIYLSEKWSLIAGLNILYNFGMEFNMDRLKNPMYTSFTHDGYGEYKFSSLSFEMVLGFGFGRPK